SYTVTEGNQSGWVHTTATSANLTLTTCVNPATVLFGNVCLGAGRTGGGGLGFWTNKNGQALLTASSLCALNTLCLRNADGSNYDPVSGCPAPTNSQVNAGKTSLKNWLLNAYATNMSYMLSAQLAALKLNVLLGYVDGTRLIYAPGTNSANAAGFATVNDVMAEANSLLCANGVIDAGNPLRARAEAVKNALEGASSNNNFVQLQPCAIALPTNAISQNTRRPIVTDKPVEVNALWLVKASPNPSKDFFNLTIISDNRVEVITLRVIDFQGRVMETRNGLRSGQTIQVGNNLRPGTYLIETVQGKDRRSQTIIKQ
ncbi:MAG: T9SS type A sorting domain-containing protein, partial [Ferruginibacter sp.]